MSEVLLESLSEERDQAVAGLGLDDLDGGLAATEVSDRLRPGEQVRDFTYDSDRYDAKQRFSHLLTDRDSEERFGQAIAYLSGYMVYSLRLPEDDGPLIRPVLVSGELGATPRLRLRELVDDNMSPVGVDNQQLVLSGIAQLEAPSIGSHDRVKKVGAEAGHLMAALGGTVIDAVGAQIRRGQDVMHELQARGNLLSTSFRSLSALPPLEGSFTYQQWRQAAIRLLWPLAEVEHFGAGPRPADLPDAVPLATVHAYRTVRQAGRSDAAKDLMERTVAG